MERFRLIYEQIEEAKRMLQTHSVLNLRMALILLDNVAELMMYRELEWSFAHYGLFEHFREYADNVPESMVPSYTEEERRDSEREFDPKLRILDLRLKKLPHDTAEILRVCHRLRTEAFHRGELRSQILITVTTLLLHTVAQLTTILKPGTYALRGGKPTADELAFMKRFGFEERQALLLTMPEALAQMATKLVEGVDFQAKELSDALATDLVERIDDTLSNLISIGDPKNDEEADDQLQHSQFWQEVGANLAKDGTREPQLTEEYGKWKAAGGAKFTFAKLNLWRRRGENIRNLGNPARALELYWALDRRFVPLEEYATEALWRYEEEIDRQVRDRLR